MLNEYKKLNTILYSFSAVVLFIYLVYMSDYFRLYINDFAFTNSVLFRILVAIAFVISFIIVCLIERKKWAILSDIIKTVQNQEEKTAYIKKQKSNMSVFVFVLLTIMFMFDFSHLFTVVVFVTWLVCFYIVDLKIIKIVTAN